jgi:hypothetical protein
MPGLYAGSFNPRLGPSTILAYPTGNNPSTFHERIVKAGERILKCSMLPVSAKFLQNKVVIHTKKN